MTSEPTPTAIPTMPTFPLDFGSIRNMIDYRFTVLDAYIDVNGLPTFQVSSESMKSKFQMLLRDLANHRLLAKISKVSDKLVISVFPKPHLRPPNKRVNLLMLLATAIAVGYAAYEVIFTQLLFPSDPRISNIMNANLTPADQVVLLVVGILAIFGLHESGHVVAIRHHKMDATLPYFIPGPPPAGTFGAFIQLRSPPANRDQLFDLGFSGPVTGFAVIVVVAIVALYISPTITTQQATQLFGAKLLQTVSWPNEPYLLDLLFQFGWPPVSPGDTVVLSKVTWAVYVGALVTFLNLLPAWQLDGGHIFRATLGRHGHIAATIAALGILVVTGYFVFAVLIGFFMFASRRPFEGLEPLDDISPLSLPRKLLFLAAVAMLALSFWIL